MKTLILAMLLVTVLTGCGREDVDQRRYLDRNAPRVYPTCTPPGNGQECVARKYGGQSGEAHSSAEEK